jgi:hypothetical protein
VTVGLQGELLMSNLERAASIIGALLLGTAGYLIISDRQRSAGNQSTRRQQEQPVEELAEELKQAWAGYHNR